LVIGYRVIGRFARRRITQPGGHIDHTALLVVHGIGAQEPGETPWAASWIARLFVGPEVYGPWVDRASLVLLFMMLLTFAVAPRNRASKVHRAYWK
jgi:hypothetical protein